MPVHRCNCYGPVLRLHPVFPCWLRLCISDRESHYYNRGPIEWYKSLIYLTICNSDKAGSKTNVCSHFWNMSTILLPHYWSLIGGSNHGLVVITHGPWVRRSMRVTQRVSDFNSLLSFHELFLIIKEKTLQPRKGNTSVDYTKWKNN